jgi:hypothetical protein
MINKTIFMAAYWRAKRKGLAYVCRMRACKKYITVRQNKETMKWEIIQRDGIDQPHDHSKAYNKKFLPEEDCVQYMARKGLYEFIRIILTMEKMPAQDCYDMAYEMAVEHLKENTFGLDEIIDLIPQFDKRTNTFINSVDVQSLPIPGLPKNKKQWVPPVLEEELPLQRSQQQVAEDTLKQLIQSYEGCFGRCMESVIITSAGIGEVRGALKVAAEHSDHLNLAPSFLYHSRRDVRTPHLSVLDVS